MPVFPLCGSWRNRGKRQIFPFGCSGRIGEMFHGALKMISDYLKEHDIPWSTLTLNKLGAGRNCCGEILAPKLQNRIFLSTNRHHIYPGNSNTWLDEPGSKLIEHAGERFCSDRIRTWIRKKWRAAATSFHIEKRYEDGIDRADRPRG